MRAPKALVVAAGVGLVLVGAPNVAAALARPAAPEMRVPFVDPLTGSADGGTVVDGSGAASWHATAAPDAAAAPATVDPATVEPVSQPAATTPPRTAQLPSQPSSRPAGLLPRARDTWVATTAAATGIPARAVQAYGDAALQVGTEQPACRIGWPTLAGIGWIESGHGTHGGAVLGADGRPSVPIVGPALDGSPGTAAIHATAQSTAWHGDPVWDHAVGPMQFIPSTWARWGADGDGDGVADPQDVDDAALAAARYLCAGGRDLSTWDGWHAALLSYNHAESYAQSVYARTSAYAAASR